MLAGLGTAGMLVGAVAAVAALTAGVVAFDRWPGSPEASERSAIPLAGGFDGATARIARAAGAVVVATATAARTGDGGASTKSSSTAGAGATPRESTTSAGDPGATSGEPAASGSTPPTVGTAPKAPASVGVADVADDTGSQLSGAVKNGGAAVAGAARPVNAPTADAVTSLSERVGNAVAAATRAVSELLRGVATPPPGSR
jgi:hypothetical protein